MSEGIKVCRKCGESKPFSDFSKARPGKGDRFGIVSTCKPCRASMNRLWHEKNKIRSLENSRDWKLKNKERVSQYAKEWALKNPEKKSQNNKIWKKSNPAKNCANAARKKALNISSTPIWLSAIQLAQIQEFYEIARAKTVQTGIKYHVDHIHPIQGLGFSGLNVPWNLQILTAKENISKKNKFPESDAAMVWGL